MASSGVSEESDSVIIYKINKSLKRKKKALTSNRSELLFLSLINIGTLIKTIFQKMVAHAFNPSTGEAEAGESLWVPGQPEMAQRLRALTVLPEVLSSIPSNHMVAHNHL